MASIGISCSICSELYKSSDEIHSTSCGHIFHVHCIREWQARSSQCPTCRAYSSQGHRIYLSFEEGSSESEKKVLELKSQLELSLLNASVLQQNLDDSERDFLNIQKQFSEHEEHMKELNKKNEYLILQNDSREKDIELKTIEIHRLQEALNASSPQGSCIILQEELNLLKEKFKHISLKLEKEVRNSTELMYDKMKLQSMLEHATKSIKNTKERNQNAQNVNNNLQSTRVTQDDRTKSNSFRGMHAPKNRGCIQSVVIKNIRGTFTEESSLMQYILKLIQLMNLTLKAEDIQHVSIMERKNAETLSVLVKFATLSSKIMFLANKNKLKSHADTQDLILYEYVADNTNSLFHEAKILKSLGYKHVYCKNNKVFVRKDDKAVAMRIDRRKDIDELKRKALSCQKAEDSNTPTTNNNESLRTLHELLGSPTINLRSSSPASPTFSDGLLSFLKF